LLLAAAPAWQQQQQQRRHSPSSSLHTTDSSQRRSAEQIQSSNVQLPGLTHNKQASGRLAVSSVADNIGHIGVFPAIYDGFPTYEVKQQTENTASWGGGSWQNRQVYAVLLNT